jgi:D-xylose transport system substrate-binding protein
VLLMGQAGHSVAEARTAGVVETLKKYPAIHVVVKQYHNAWSPNLAMQTTENALTRYHNDIQAVIANNSGMAHGAVQAVEEQKLGGKVFVAGADADLSNLRDIVAGKQQFEVLISISDMAEKAARTAYALAAKQNFKYDSLTANGMVSAKTLDSPVFGVDRAGLEARIIRTGFQTHEAVFGGTASAQ